MLFTRIRWFMLCRWYEQFESFMITEEQRSKHGDFSHPGQISNYELVDGGHLHDRGVDFPGEPNWQHHLKPTMYGFRLLRYTSFIAHALMCSHVWDFSVTKCCVQLRGRLHCCARENLGLAAQSVRRWPLHPTVLPGDREGQRGVRYTYHSARSLGRKAC